MQMDLYNGRRRAAIACDFCRQRKRKCGGEQPCTLCASTGRACHYSEVDPRRSDDRQSTGLDLSQRLDDLESLVRSHSDVLAGLTSQLSSATYTASPHGQLVSPNPVAFSDVPLPTLSFTPARSPAMTIPVGHLTTVGTLLTLPAMQELVGSLEQDLLTRTEAQRLVPNALSMQSFNLQSSPWPSISPDLSERMRERFLAIVHPAHPILDRDDFSERVSRCSQSDFAPAIDSALCLVAFALAEAADSTPQALELAEDNWAPGASFFRPAVHYLLDFSMNSFGSDELLPPALYLCAVYFSFLARPFQAWRLVHMASVHLQQARQTLLRNDLLPSFDNPRASVFIRTSWAAFVLESNLLAEHHLPRSGIEQVVEDIPLPLCEHGLWLSEISIRRLLNRVHYSMYEAGAVERSNLDLPSVTIALELLRQLDEWYEMLPPDIKPTLDEEVDQSLPSRFPLLLRFHSAREVICRPFLLYACSNTGKDVTENISEMGEMCIQSAARYLQTANEYLKKSSSSTEVVMQSTFAAAIVLTIAFKTSHPSLSGNSVNEYQSMAVRALQRWSFSGSCIESMLWILQSARYRTKAAM